MRCGSIELTYRKALEAAYPAYARCHDFYKWAMEHCDKYDTETRRNMGEQYAIMHAELRGQIAFMARVFPLDEHTIRCDLELMYEDRHRED